MCYEEVNKVKQKKRQKKIKYGSNVFLGGLPGTHHSLFPIWENGGDITKFKKYIYIYMARRTNTKLKKTTDI